MVDIENIVIDDIDVAVIFRKEFLQRSQRIIYKPLKIVKGNVEFQEYMFIDEEGNSYHHLFERLPGNCFAYRKSLLDLEEEYETQDYEVIKQKYFEEIDKYNYHILIMSDDTNSDELIIVKENKVTHDLSEFDDNDALEFIDPLNLNIVEDSTDEVEEVINTSPKEITTKEVISSIDFNTHKLVDEIKKKVISQDDAIKTIVTTIWNNTRGQGIHNNILLIGNTGVGKTEIFRNISKKLDIPFFQTSMASYSKTGYVGQSVTSILDGLVKTCNGDIKKAEHGIIFLDELDKIAKNDGYNSGITDEGVQNELLKLMEDGVYQLDSDNIFSQNKEIIHTKNITFVGAGTFNGILEMTEEKHVGFGDRDKSKLNNYKEITNEHLIKYGFKPEFAGRMPVTVILNDLTKEDLIDIMKNSENNVLSLYIKMLNEQGITVNINKEVYELIAENAIKYKTGARGLNTVVNRLFSKAIYEISNPENKFNYLEITKETVYNPNNYILKNIKHKVRTLKNTTN